MLAAACGALVTLLTTPAWAQRVVHYPAPESAQDQRSEYPSELLNLALAKAGGTFVARPATTAMPKGRAIVELARGESGLEVLWALTDQARERLLLPIRIPIYKGLLGWRIPLVRRSDEALLAGVRDVEQLRRFVAGQGHDWPDVQILQASGLRVRGVANYPALFSMLQSGRYDYLPRSVVEIEQELAANRDLQLDMDTHIVLHYPAAAYFFVHPRNTELAQQIGRGLELALKDGSFDALFYKHFAGALAATQLEQRVVLELKNPLLPPETPLARSELWWAPKRPAAAGKRSP